MEKPIFRHSAGGPTGGLIDKIKELKQRFADTPGDTFQQRIDTWFDARSRENAADATGVTWPSERATRLWKFFFKADQHTTDRYGFAIKLADLDNRSEEERAAARARAAEKGTNIDADERSRRVKAGTAMVALTAAVGAVMVQAHAGPLVRLAALPTFFLGMAFIASGSLGL